MSRLDDEYDPAEHHDLARTERSLPDAHTGMVTFTPVCACGWNPAGGVAGGSHKTRRGAFQAWDQHRHQAVFG